ncbi:cupin-like domain-containing protein [Aquisalinus flavus]|uniref:Cupin n=1 Tax=Aquisalinus flavus TaxID=1526572 RepID=A0A8J2V5L4_9PROT|nr:cupin-like domain-containing protein [Aquisalinus flavus]MBD0425762.1 cupin-like domain-containing protein [Aquisalinus flavus]UNE48630.1 cupin-like domain-containing protein [Aquisalinus flavus]GGD13487.1 cupin [Aquisalinus flavus]
MELPSPRPIAERTDVTAEIFQTEILPAGEPVVMRGLVTGWPVVEAGRSSGREVLDYIRNFDQGAAVSTATGPPSLKGRLFYNEDMSGLNFRMEQIPIASSLDYLIDHENDRRPLAYAIQSVPMHDYLPGFAERNPMPLLDSAISPRLWLGNSVTIAAHQDPSENIACVAAGRRLFTLFPPEQVANLYIGQFEMTPAGVPISLVDFDAPDLERFPRFTRAMEAARSAELAPGDAIFIPYLWWHHVRSLEKINMLINYWWKPGNDGRGQPRDALLHAMLTVKALPPVHRAAWKTLFDHYVFHEQGDPAAHIPEERRGILGPLDGEKIREIRVAISNILR